MFRTVFIVAIILFGQQFSYSQSPDSVRTYIDSALYFMETKALNAKGLNWKQIKDSVYKKSEGAISYTETLPALLYAFKQLKDYHGMFANKDTLYRYPPPVNFEEVLSPGIKKEFLKGNRFDGVVVNDKGEKTVTVTNTCTVSKDFPIAVLIGKSTLSSAEILAIFLGQQSNVKTFGEPTVGYSNATKGFLFGNRQGYLLLSVNKIADAQKNVNEDMLVRPDVQIKNNDNFENPEEDPTVIAAIKWLEEKK